MVNAWSLAWEALNGTMDETYPIIDTNVGAGNTAVDKDLDWIEKSGGYEWTPGSPWPPEVEEDGLEYETDYYHTADIDDMYMHHFTNANSSYNDGWTQELSLIHI